MIGWLLLCIIFSSIMISLKVDWKHTVRKIKDPLFVASCRSYLYSPQNGVSWGYTIFSMSVILWFHQHLSILVCDSFSPIFTYAISFIFQSHFYAPPPESGGVLCYTLRNFECPSVRPSVRPSAPTTILVSATPPTVLGQSFWNFTGVLRMVWRYAYCFFRILKLFFITFFPFLT